MKKISIIVPVYNAQETLERCILSIVKQTLQEIEIILINDGSTDKSKEILENYQKRYPDFIKVKTIENAGAANARNIGLSMASGEYVGFVDSDDYIEETMYEKLYHQAKVEEAQIAVCGYFIEKDGITKPYQIGDIEQYNKSIRENANLYMYSVPYLWNKIFKRELITKNNVKFCKELRIFEDLVFTYTLFSKANRITKVDEPLYYYVKNTNSLTNGFSEKFFDIIPAIQMLRNNFQETEMNLDEILLYIALNHIYIRCRKKVTIRKLPLKIKYINQMFQFLDEEFPNWKNHNLYFEHNQKEKKKYISKKYWKRRTLVETLRLKK